MIITKLWEKFFCAINYVLNSFFGYRYIKAIKLNIINHLNNNKEKFINKKNLEKKFEINEIKDHELKKNLQTLIKAYNEKKS